MKALQRQIYRANSYKHFTEIMQKSGIEVFPDVTSLRASVNKYFQFFYT